MRTHLGTIFMFVVTVLSFQVIGCAGSESTPPPASTTGGTGGGGGSDCVPGQEVCDQADNDCDGEVDEGLNCECYDGDTQDCYTGPQGTENVGICAMGTQSCDPATNTFGPCVGEVTPEAAEECNGLDDNCDGQVDEGIPDLVCGIGGCEVTAPGCVNGAVGTCVPGMPELEVCDGIDNNCNQLVDETFPGSGDVCDTGIPGVCAAGTSQCLMGVPTCVADMVATLEVCDGIDNDCNGVADDNIPGTGSACSTGYPGVCSAGMVTCQNSVIDCFPIVAASPELCDGLDNDCDGVTDEGNPESGSACNTGQPGICQIGTENCVSGAIACIPDNVPIPEVCDGLDNNCDGQTDEGNPGAGSDCNCGGTTACSSGALVCMGGLAVGCELLERFDASCAANWTLNGDWQCGTPASVGPTTAYSMPACLATRLTTNYSANQTYANTTATSPPIDLTLATNPQLSFRVWLDTEGSVYDGFNLKVSTDGTTFTQVTTVSPPYNLTIASEQAWGGHQGTFGWQEFTADLSPYAGETIYLSFAFRSDTIVQYPGVYIDDVVVAEPGTVFPLEITTTSPLPDALTGVSYQVPLQRGGGTPAAVWSIVGGTNHGWLTVDPATGVLSGTPGAANAGPFSVTVHVEEPADPTNFDEATLTGTVVAVVNFMGFEGTCPDGWALTGDWQCGTPTGTGPGGCYAGTHCIGTQLAGYYNNNQTYLGTTATSPAIDLTSTTSPQLSFQVWLYTEGFTYDGFNLKISTDGVNFTQVTTIAPPYNLTVGGEQCWGGNQSTLGWQEFTADLAAYAGQTVYLRFAFRTDGSVTYPGVYIDDVAIID